MGLETEIAEAVFEFGDLAFVLEARGAAGPCRVRGRVNIEVHGVAFFAPSGLGLELGSIGHFDGDHVIFWMDIFFHDGSQDQAVWRF